MGSDLFSLTPFSFCGIQDGYVSLQEEVAEFHGKQHSFSETNFQEHINYLTSAHSKEDQGDHLFKDQNQNQQQEVPKFDIPILEEFGFDLALQTTQPFQETTGLNDQAGVASSELVNEYNKQVAGKVPQSSSLASLELLCNYASRFNKLRVQEVTDLHNSEARVNSQNLSAEEIIRVAGARYVQFSAQWYDNFIMPMHPSGFGLGILSEEENKDVELAQFLLAAAERVGCQQFERAGRLLLHCLFNSSPTASAAERVIFHFAQALRERIEKEIGRVILKVSDKNIEDELIRKLNTNVALTCHQRLPFNQVMQFAGVQAIVEHVASYTKIHLIDLDIRHGMQWTCLMQALAERHEKQVVRLKITAIGVTGRSETTLEETGKRLASFAESLNLPFSYKKAFVREMIEQREQHLETEDDEAVAVYAPYVLRTMVSRPDCLENLIGIMRNIKPAIMIVLGVEANHNSSSFVNRFIEALFHYAAFFYCLETCIKEDIESRTAVEAILFEGIRNIVAAEGRERTVRNVKIDVWRRFFARYRMMEIGFSESSLYQAKLVAKDFTIGNFCTLEKNGKCLTVGWKGTPMHSVSAWKFR